MMPFRAHFLDKEGHPALVVDLYCADEATALERITTLRQGRDVEVWYRDRLIKRIMASERPGLEAVSVTEADASKLR